MEKKRTLNQMPGFRKGFEAADKENRQLGVVGDFPEEHLAYALGVIARIYTSVEEPEKLWELRKKFWQIEETLGDLQQKGSGSDSEHPSP